MCDGRIGRGRIPRALALLLTAIAPSGAQGQDTEAALRTHIDSLVPLVEAARLEAEAAEAAVEARNRRAAERESAVDTLRIGVLTVLAPSADAARARAIFESVLREHFAGAESPALADGVFTFHVGQRTDPIYVVPGASVHRVRAGVDDTEARVTLMVRAALADATARDLDGLPVQEWARHNPLLDPDGAEVYRAVATAASRATRSCLAGDIAACTHALGLDLPDEPFVAWYSPDERVALVEERWRPPTLRAGPPDYRRCIGASDVEACDRLLKGYSASLSPLPGSVRGSLLWVALRRGGEGAWARLVEAPTRSPEDAVAHAAGVALPELVAEWRAWMIEQRPASHAGLGLQGLIGLLWLALFATLASRSTRWRLG